MQCARTKSIILKVFDDVYIAYGTLNTNLIVNIHKVNWHRMIEGIKRKQM